MENKHAIGLGLPFYDTGRYDVKRTQYFPIALESVPDALLNLKEIRILDLLGNNLTFYYK
ncbi:MAG: hypothetical protein ACTSRI_21770 [Promethearchaeota archaeon]